MGLKRFCAIAVMAVSICLGTAQAGDFVITLPKKSKLTPVQGLNQEGVEALRKNQPERAKAAFYKAYLLDPDDPFTLNNLGYMAEMEGDAVRAHRLYELAAQQANNAAVGLSSSPQLEGESFAAAIGGIRSVAVETSRANFEAIHLLSQNRPVEADTLLQETLKLDPSNAFTLNNLGVAREMEGDYEGALRNYSTAANLTDSKRTAIVTSDQAASGRSIRELASENAQRLRIRIQESNSAQAQAAYLNFQGVAAVNRNEWHKAAQDFLAAYKADPSNAFSINNIGYVAEMDGDLETAQSYYESARRALDSNATVGLATRASAQGEKLFAVADDSGQKVTTEIEQEHEAKRHEVGPIRLKRRDGQPVTPAPQQTPEPQNPPYPRPH